MQPWLQHRYAGVTVRVVEQERVEWVLLAYRLPREPSTPRIALWRKLRRLGAAQVADGVVALPADSRTREHVDWLADYVLDHGGEASVWVARLGSRAQEEALVERMRTAVAEQYRAVLAEADEAARADDGTRQLARRLRRELRRIDQRDFFPPPERDAARAGVAALARRVSA